MPCIPTDALHVTLAQVEPEAGWNYNVPRLKAAKQLQPIISALAQNLDSNWPDALIEGSTVLPQHVTLLRRKGIDVRSCFLGWSSLNLELAIRHGQPESWLAKQPADEQERHARNIVTFSRHIQRLCVRHGQPYIDMAAGQYRRQHASALRILLGQ